VIVGQKTINTLPGKSNAAAPALAYYLPGAGTAGTVFLAVIAGVAFATILAVVAGLAITASASFAHDIYNAVNQGREGDPDVRGAGRPATVVVIGVLAIIGGIAARSLNIAFLVSLASLSQRRRTCRRSSSRLYWKRFNTRGSVMSIYGGLISALVLIAFSPAVMAAVGTTKPLATAMLPDLHWAGSRSTPAIVSVPIGFLFGVIGTLTSKETNPEKQAERKSVRSPEPAPRRRRSTDRSRTKNRTGVSAPVRFRLCSGHPVGCGGRRCPRPPTRRGSSPGDRLR